MVMITAHPFVGSESCFDHDGKCLIEDDDSDIDNDNSDDATSKRFLRQVFFLHDEDEDPNVSISGTGCVHTAAVLSSPRCVDVPTLSDPNVGFKQFKASSSFPTSSPPSRSFTCARRSSKEAKTKMRKSLSVTFGTVGIRDYVITLGDNPSVSSGPPITLSWEYDRLFASVTTNTCSGNITTADFVLTDLSVDAYEAHKKMHPPRDKYEMAIPAHVREQWLLNAGFSRGELAEAIRGVDRIKSSRIRNAPASSVWSKKTKTAEEFVKRAANSFAFFFVRGRRIADPIRIRVALTTTAA